MAGEVASYGGALSPFIMSDAMTEMLPDLPPEAAAKILELQKKLKAVLKKTKK